MILPERSPKRKSVDGEDEEREVQPPSKAKPIPATNPDRVFPCKTCNKEFSSFQALGGHRASHSYKNPKPFGADVASKKLHECHICFVKFETGQALGGHMRKHPSERENPKWSMESSSKSDFMTREEKSEGDKLRSGDVAPVARDFFAIGPVRVEAVPVEMVPVMEIGDSWLNLKLGMPGGD